MALDGRSLERGSRVKAIGGAVVGVSSPNVSDQIPSVGSVSEGFKQVTLFLLD